ncbi:MAG: hypothetical protein AAGH65_11805 [Pseudomonadota bacterium]
MNSRIRQPHTRPWHFMVVGILSLLWNGFGAFDYLATKLRWSPYMANFSDTQLAYFNTVPLWQEIAWAVGIWGAVLGSIGLILARRWSVALFALSLIGMLASFSTVFWLEQARAATEESGWAFTAAIVVVGVLLLAYSRKRAQQGQLT